MPLTKLMKGIISMYIPLNGLAFVLPVISVISKEMMHRPLIKAVLKDSGNTVT